MAFVSDEELDEDGKDIDTQADDLQSTPSVDREALVADTYAEGIENSVIEKLSEKDEVTIEDLRQLPGSAGLTDDQLTAAWAKAQKDAGIVTDAAKTDLPFPVYDAQGNKISADKVNIADLLSGKALIGYQAMGKEQRKAFADVVRNASQGHWNEHRYTTVQQQYKAATQQLETLQKESASHKDMQGQWNAALTALVMGDNNPMRAMVEAYKGALGKSGITPEGFVPQDTVRAQQEDMERGNQWYTDTGLPAAMDIANRYSADAKEVMGAIKYFIENEPNLTPQRIDEIIKFDVPYAFEANGYMAKDSGTSQDIGPRTNGVMPSNEVAELQKQVTALTARLAGASNARTESIRDKGRKIPPAGSGATSGAGDSMPAFNSRAAMKDWLQS